MDKPRKVPDVGSKVVSVWPRLGDEGVMTVVKTDPWTHALTDTLVRNAHGDLCWYAASDLRPV